MYSGRLAHVVDRAHSRHGCAARCRQAGACMSVVVVVVIISARTPGARRICSFLYGSDARSGGISDGGALCDGEQHGAVCTCSARWVLQRGTNVPSAVLRRAGAAIRTLGWRGPAYVCAGRHEPSQAGLAGWETRDKCARAHVRQGALGTGAGGAGNGNQWDRSGASGGLTRHGRERTRVDRRARGGRAMLRAGGHGTVRR
jgi:hypothetical protein